MMSVSEVSYKMRYSRDCDLLVFAGFTMEKERNSETNLTPAEIREFKVILLAKRNKILGNLTCMEAETLHRQLSNLSNLPIHMADVGSDNYEIENTLGLMDSERKLISEIDAALERIEDETYGICEGSGKPIPKARLEAIPWARYCVEYAKLLEKGLVQREKSFNSTSYDYKTDNEEDEDLKQSYWKTENL